MTSYTKGVESRVMVGDVDNVYSADFTRNAYGFMSEYTRYENNWANGNALMLRPDYDELGVEFYEMDLDGYKREYMVYVPESILAIYGNTREIPHVLIGSCQLIKKRCLPTIRISCQCPNLFLVFGKTQTPPSLHAISPAV